jgi:hypothetical protein
MTSFGDEDSSHPLSLDMYEKQDGRTLKPKHQGWRLLNQHYVDFVSRMERAAGMADPKAK